MSTLRDFALVAAGAAGPVAAQVVGHVFSARADRQRWRRDDRTRLRDRTLEAAIDMCALADDGLIAMRQLVDPTVPQLSNAEVMAAAVTRRAGVKRAALRVRAGAAPAIIESVDRLMKVYVLAAELAMRRVDAGDERWTETQANLQAAANILIDAVTEHHDIR